ncbi:MAG: DUF429 domain-containing protein [Myxococcota bacterium]
MDVAVVDLHGRCTFTQLPPFSATLRVSDWLRPLGARPESGDVLVLDGPLGLARHGRSTRDCERRLGAPGHTPDVLPAPDSRPFAGYIRSSVELGIALHSVGWMPAFENSVEASSANLLEAFPGGTWTRLAGRRLPGKVTAAGRAARERLLSEANLTFADGSPLSHDQLDAALCAWLGWQLRRAPSRIATVGEPTWRDGAVLREGFILQVTDSLDVGWLPPPPPRRTSARPASARQGGVRLPAGVHADWVYFATPARADRWETAQLALCEGVICRPAHNAAGARVANVGQVAPGDRLLLAYSEGGTCEIIGVFEVLHPTVPLPGAPGVEVLDDAALRARLQASGYPTDPTVGAHTGFLVEPVFRPESRMEMERPRGNNALWRVNDAGARASS